MPYDTHAMVRMSYDARVMVGMTRVSMQAPCHLSSLKARCIYRATWGRGYPDENFLISKLKTAKYLILKIFYKIPVNLMRITARFYTRQI
jgi:hypothetical protein